VGELTTHPRAQTLLLLFVKDGSPLFAKKKKRESMGKGVLTSLMFVTTQKSTR
jgi:hypothetical protein